MFIETLPTPGLAHRAYLVGAGDQAVVLDPRREPEHYLAAARRRGCRITCVLETHRNEDYVNGGLALSERTGAPVLHGAGIPWGYGRTLRDGEELTVGDLLLRVLHTPGHTPESVSFVLFDRSTGDSPLAVFTGDALFVGDVGRTDLWPIPPEQAAGALYDSLHGKLLPLGDHVVVYPAHGAGSVCGVSLAHRDFTTLGYERRHNPLLQLDRAAFIARKIAEQPLRPPYFRQMERVNLAGLGDPGVRPPLRPLSPEALDAQMRGGALVLDVRDPSAIAGAVIPGALTLPLDVLTTWAGWFLPYDRDLVLVCDTVDCARAARKHLARIGLERVVGWLQGGMMAWARSGRPYAHLPTLSGPALRQELGRVRILDVRRSSEWEAGHLPGSIHCFLGDLPGHMSQLPRDRRLVTFCSTGRRSTVAAGLLLRAGFSDVAVALGSMEACRAAGCLVVTEADAQPV